MIEDLRDGLDAQGYNDLHFSNVSLPIDSEALGIRANIKASGGVRGLVGFLLKKFTGFVTYTFDVEWPEIDLLIEPYDLEGYVHLIQIFGAGTLHVNVKQLDVSGSIMLMVVPGDSSSVYVRKLTIKLALGKDQDEDWFSVTGWLNDPLRSQIISELVRENLQLVLTEYGQQINTFLSNTLLSLLKDVHIPMPS